MLYNRAGSFKSNGFFFKKLIILLVYNINFGAICKVFNFENSCNNLFFIIIFNFILFENYMDFLFVIIVLFI